LLSAPALNLRLLLFAFCPFAFCFVARSLHDFLFLKRTYVVLCRRELIFKTLADPIFSMFCLVVEAAAKMRLISIQVKCYFHFFYIYFFNRKFQKTTSFLIRRVANIRRIGQAAKSILEKI